MRDVFILDQRGLLNDLTRVAQKLRALLREQNTPAVAQKDGDARFLLQLAHGGGKAGLGDKQRLCGLGDGAADVYKRQVRTNRMGKPLSRSAERRRKSIRSFDFSTKTDCQEITEPVSYTHLRNRGVNLSIDFLDVDHVALTDAVLFATSRNNRVHYGDTSS